MKRKVRLGVNIDHAATLRQVRGATTPYPDLLEMVKLAKAGGAEQITIHLREDRRHIQDDDVVRLCKLSPLEINLEMGATKEMLKIALRNKPTLVCMVPEKREELTTEGGLNIVKGFKNLESMTHQLKVKRIKVSFFIEPSLKQVQASALAGADAVEFHTGHWVLLSGYKKNTEWKRLVMAAKEAHRLGLRVHAGHGLDYKHSRLIKKLPHLVEANIGHSLICYSLKEGLQKSVRNMVKALN
jgi:pyridoxine 5-phosphate synthase